MPTRFYLPHTAPAITPAFGDGTNSATLNWSNVTPRAASDAATIDRAALSRTRYGSAGDAAHDLADHTATNSTGGATIEFDLVRQYVSDKLVAQTIAGNVSGVIRTWESSASLNATIALGIRLVDGETGAHKSWLLLPMASDLTSTAPPEMSGTNAAASSTRCFNNTSESTTIALSQQTAVLGDRLVVEIGFRKSNTVTSRTTSPRFGDSAATDFALTNALTTDLCPWIEFTQVLNFVATGTRTASPVTAAFKAFGVTCTATPVDAALLTTAWRSAAVDAALSTGAAPPRRARVSWIDFEIPAAPAPQTRTSSATPVSAALSLVASRVATPLAAALLQQSSRTAVPISTALTATLSHIGTPITLALLGTLNRTATPSGALSGGNLMRVATPVSAAVQSTPIRAATPIAAALSITLSRVATPVTVALLASWARTAAPVAAVLSGGNLMRVAAPITAALLKTASRSATPTAALAAGAVPRRARVSWIDFEIPAAVGPQTGTRTATPVAVALQARPTRIATSVTAATSAVGGTAINVDGATLEQIVDGLGWHISAYAGQYSDLTPILDSMTSDGGGSLFPVDPQARTQWAPNESDVLTNPYDFSLNTTMRQVFEGTYTGSWSNATSESRNWSLYFPAFWQTLAFLYGRGQTNVVVTCQGHSPLWAGTETSILQAKENSFARMIVSMVHYGRSVKGLPIKLLSLLNEPDIDGVEGPLIGSAQFNRIVTQVRTELDSLGYTDVKFLAPQGANGVGLASDINADGTNKARVQAWASHSYDADKGADVNTATNFWNRPLWVTEYGTFTIPPGDLEHGSDVSDADQWTYARVATLNLFNLILAAGAGGAACWEGIECLAHNDAWSYNGYWSYPNHAETSGATYRAKKRYWTTALIYGAIPAGWRRIGATCSDANLTVQAFTDGAGGVSVVGYNANGVDKLYTLNLTNLTAPSTVYHRESTSTEDRVTRAVLGGGSSFSATISANAFFVLTSRPLISTHTHSATPVSAALAGQQTSTRTASPVAAALASTPTRTALVSAVLSGGRSRIATPVAAVLSRANLLRAATPLTAALLEIGWNTASPIAAALGVTGTRTAAVTASFQATPVRVAAVTATLSGGRSRIGNPISAALSALGRTRSATSVGAALAELDQPRTATSVGAALTATPTRAASVTAALREVGWNTGSPISAALGVTATRATSPVAAPLSTTGARPAPVTAALQATLARAATLTVVLSGGRSRIGNPISAALSALGRTRVSTVSAALSALDQSRTATPVRVPLQATLTRAAGVSGALLEVGWNTAASVAAVLSAASTRASVSIAAALQASPTRTGAPVSAALSGGTSHSATTSAALKALGVPRTSSPVAVVLQATPTRTASASAVLAYTRTRTATPVRAALRGTWIQQASPIAASLQTPDLSRTTTPVSAATLRTILRTTPVTTSICYVRQHVASPVTAAILQGSLRVASPVTCSLLSLTAHEAHPVTASLQWLVPGEGVIFTAHARSAMFVADSRARTIVAGQRLRTFKAKGAKR